MKLAQPKTTLSFFLDTRYKKKATDKYPLKLRVNFKGERLYLNLNYDLSEDEFNSIISQKVRGRLLDIQLRIEADKAKANSIIESMQTFNFSTFKQLMSINQTTQTLDWYFSRYIAKIADEDRIGTSTSYQTAYNVLKAYFGSKFSFQHITPTLLRNFENDYLAKGKSIATVALYLRSLRAVYNDAKSEGSISEADYPFGRKKYIIPTSGKRNVGISKAQVLEIHQYQFEEPIRNFYKDMWLFCFHCNGLNFKDIAYLKYANIVNGVLTFTREKARLTSRKAAKIISLNLNKNALEIIAKWGNADKKKNNFLFPILTDEMDVKTKFRTYRQLTKMISNTSTIISNEKGWPFEVKYQHARHSFSNLLQTEEQPIHVIQQALGHSDYKTTEHYLRSLEESKRKQISSFTEFD